MTLAEDFATVRSFIDEPVFAGKADAALDAVEQHLEALERERDTLQSERESVYDNIRDERLALVARVVALEAMLRDFAAHGISEPYLAKRAAAVLAEGQQNDTGMEHFRETLGDD